jgi:uncharacterized protein
MPMRDLPPDLARLSLAEVEAALVARRLPPVEKWHPERSGDSEMRIAADGTWFHQGAPVARPAMVRLFSTILRREPDGSFALVTPVEKLSIEVEDAPFVAVEARSEGEGESRRLAFRLNTDDVTIAGPDHELSLRGEAALYLHIRAGLEARVARAPWYELAEWALDEGAEPVGLWSDGAFFPFAA